MTETVLTLDRVVKCFPRTATPAVADVSLALKQGEILGLLGPSGCGKTTLLRLIAGFDRPSQGRIVLAGRTVAGDGGWLPPERRQVGMVFQEFALFPHLTVAENIAFGLRRQYKRQSAIVKDRVRDAIALVELTGLEKRYPHELSGGQRQRVALARALAPQPILMLLDEPLSNLDVQVRLHLREAIRHILKQTGTTAVFVTHDREEAFGISDWVGVMRGGQLEQFGTPEQLYRQPASQFVARFVTQANFLEARRKNGLWETEVGCFAAELEVGNVGDAGTVTVREEDLQLQPHENGEVTISDRAFLGREHRYCLQTPSGHELHARSDTLPSLPVGTRVRLSAPPEALRVFPQDR
mgnify:CR=1 FL=1